ncbi:Arm DNA-binding domain-containing protein [Bartonella sp. LJL80]
MKSLKPKEKIYKVRDQQDLHVTVALSGTITFQNDYRMDGRHETVTFGRYGKTGISLAIAREMLLDAKRAIREGRSPAIEKQSETRRIKEADNFAQFGQHCSNRIMRQRKYSIAMSS